MPEADMSCSTSIPLGLHGPCNGTFERQFEKGGDKASFSFRPF